MDNLELGKKYDYIVIVYQYLGTVFSYGHHEDEDWAVYNDKDLKQALHIFWDHLYRCENGFWSRVQYRKDFKLLNVLTFNDVNEYEAWVNNWWKKEHKLRLGIIA